MTNTFGNEIHLEEESKMISCYEQKENLIYCAYISQESNFVSKLILLYIEVNPNKNEVIKKGSQLLLTFFNSINYIKALPLNEAQAIILLRLEKEDSSLKCENSEGNMFYYHIEISNEGNNSIKEINLKNFHSDCRYKIPEEDEEEEPIEVFVLSEKRIYISCEDDNGMLKGYEINPRQNKINEFYFNAFDSKALKNPVFAKFENSLGIFYIQISKNNKYDIMLQLINFPECIDYYEKSINIIPRNLTKTIDFSKKAFMNNPYPISRKEEPINVIFKEYKNILMTNIYNDTEKISPGKRYNPEDLKLKVTPFNIIGFYSIEYVPIRNNSLDGFIEGKTCIIPFYTPKCLKQCYSCMELGTQMKQACLGCANENYYIEKYEGAVDLGFGLPHNCIRCNESCSSCYNKFVSEPNPTTNCKKCDIFNGYYPLISDEKTCISLTTQDYWEKIFNRAIYLDKSESNKSNWHWRICHENCNKCQGPGTDEDNKCDSCKEGFHFFYWQTKGKGIPGSCYNNYENNGCLAVFIEAGALFESGLDKTCDKVILLTANRDTLIKRILERDHIDVESANQRLNIQKDIQFLKSNSDMVLFNEGEQYVLQLFCDLIIKKINYWNWSKEHEKE